MTEVAVITGAPLVVAGAPDPLASPDAVRSISEELQAWLPDLIPIFEKHLVRFLGPVWHIERRPAMDISRGRPSRRSRETLTEGAGTLRAVLECETRGRISLSSFIGRYLPIIQCPSVVTDALSLDHVNLQEAARLTRLTPAQLNGSDQAS